jgi:hypothetical protein
MSNYAGLDAFTLINFAVLFALILGVIIFRKTIGLRIMGENTLSKYEGRIGLVYSEADYKKRLDWYGRLVVGVHIGSLGMISIFMIKKAPEGVYEVLIVGLPYAAAFMFVGIMLYGVSIMKIVKIKPTIKA